MSSLYMANLEKDLHIPSSHEVLAAIIFGTPAFTTFFPNSPPCLLTFCIFIFIFYLSMASLHVHLCPPLHLHIEAVCLLRRQWSGKGSKYLYLISGFVSITYPICCKCYLVVYMTICFLPLLETANSLIQCV